MPVPKALRNVFSPLAVAGSLAFGSEIATAAPALTEQEQLAVTTLAERGLTKILLLNEKKGHLLLIENGSVVNQMSAVTGKHSGDDVKVNRSVTPAGIYPLTPSSHDLSTASSSIMFYELPEDTNQTYTFHRVVAGREKALAGSNPARKRLSNGCVNLFDADFRTVATYAMTSAKTVVYSDGQEGKHASWVVILPESPNLDKTRAILKDAATYTFR